MTIDNPFYHRGAIRHAADFHGRTAEINQILGLLRNGQSVSLIGPRRIGKSSLLLHLTRPTTRQIGGLDPNTLLVLIDCQEIGGAPAEEVYEALTTALLDTAEDAGLTLNLSQRLDSYRAFDRAINRIYRQEYQVVILFDEFELLAANEQLTPYFFARLRGLTTKYGLAYLTASQRPLFDITADEEILSSPFFNIFVTLPLGLYSPDEAHSLFTTRLANDKPFPPNLINHLINLVGCHPFFLHIAGYHTYQFLSQNNTPNLKQIDELIEVEADSHLGYLWQNLSDSDQYALAITAGPVDNIRLLEQQCLITSDEDGYQYSSEILRRFVRRQQVTGLIQAGPFVINPQRHQVHIHGRENNLTNSQFDLLTCLASRYEKVVPSDVLETAVWGDALVDDPDRLKTLIKRLRRAIEPYGSWIISERGIGYALRPPEA
ncbi:MAG TPA: winged helix-turn-helix domain-containing protein [Anaerolineae bacterium]|nr:winged helix-turn-helix domain-containing protein [Anaerolineae bacterium]